MSGKFLGDAVDGGWTRRVELGDDKAILLYDDGVARFAHRCDRGDRGVVLCSPLLQIGNGHTIVQADPLTIRASILCEDCGTHGWVTDGAWESA